MKHILGIFILLCSYQLQAGIYGYDHLVPAEIDNYMWELNRAKTAAKPECESMYRPMIQDGVLDIRYALGYFDHSTGMQVKQEQTNFGYSPSLDIPIFEALRQHLTSMCKNRNTRFCGFSVSGDRRSGKLVFEKSVTIHQQRVLVRLTLTQASASEYYAENLNRLASQQQFLINQSEENFFGGIETADVVFYNGHSRSGGGPDFRPPVLNKSKKANYSGYYKVQKPGLKKMVAGLNQNPNQGFILGLFSCYSRSLFQKPITDKNPSQRMILSSDEVNYFQTLKASIGYLEGIMRGQCGDDLARTAKQDDAIRKGFLQFNMK